MRNLKKILSLVLALMMVLSVMVTASATDFTDDASITNKEAVEVMSALGILSGSQGKFDPTGTLTRSQAAKIIAFLKLGADTDTLLKGTGAAQFSDVAATSWAFDYVSYCASKGIVSGSQGKFAPNGSLIGYEFGKMVLVAAGVEGTYTGSDWKINVATALNKAKLLDGLDNLVLSNKLTREQAAQLAFNAMNYSVQGTSKEYVVKDGKGNVVYQGTDAMTALLMKASDDTYTLSLGESIVGSLADTVYGLKVTTSTDDFGRTSTTYVDKANAKKVYASFAATPVYTLKGTTTEGKLAAQLGCTKASDSVTVTVITDGAAAAAKTIKKADTATVGFLGATVEVYKTGASSYNVIVIKTHAKELTAADVKAAKKATNTTDATPAYIVLEGTGATYGAAGTYDNTKGFKAGDVVLYTVGKGNIQSVELAQAVTGKIQKYSGSATLTVNGVVYKNAGAIDAKAIGFNTEKTFYADADNNVYLVGDVAAAPAITADGVFYVVAFQIQYKAGTDSDLFGDGASATAAVKAKVVTATGESKVIDLATYTKKDAAGNEKIYYVGMDGKETEIKANASGTPNQWVAYTEKDGAYTVCALSQANAKLVKLTADYAKGTVKLTGGTNPYMTSGTAYTYINTKDGIVKTTTGYKNIAIAKDTELLVVFADAKQTTVKQLYSLKSTTDASGSKANYAYVAQLGDSVADGTEVTYYINGEVKTLVTTATVAEGTVYNLTIDAKGIVTGAAKVAVVDAEKAAKVIAVEDSYVVTETSATVFAKAGVQVFNLIEGQDGVADTIEVGDYIFVATAGDDDNATLVYIVG